MTYSTQREREKTEKKASVFTFNCINTCSHTFKSIRNREKKSHNWMTRMCVNVPLYKVDTC